MTEHSVQLVDLDRLAREKAGKSHSIFSPSSSPTWFNCAGALIPNVLAQDDAGEDAAYGTVAHMLTEAWLKTDRRPDYLLDIVEWVESGDWGYLIEIDDLMFDYVRQCVDWVQLLEGDHFVEVRVDFSKITPIPHQKGTSDLIVCRYGHMVVVDWKFGKHHPVRAKNNSQALLYALGAFYEYDDKYWFETIEIRIGQPRLDNWDVWVINRDQLLAFEKEVKPRAYAAWNLRALRTPGIKQCEWCKIRGSCTAAAQYYGDMMAGVFDDLSDYSLEDGLAFESRVIETGELPQRPVGTLSDEALVGLFLMIGAAANWWKALKAEAYRRWQQGQQLPGLKAVEGRSLRVFSNEQAVAEALEFLGLDEDVIWERDLISPAQTEKALCKIGYRMREMPVLIGPLIYKPPGKISLVALDDKRPALTELTSHAFDDLTEDETWETELWI